MTLQNLKRLLIFCLSKNGVNPDLVSQEIVNQIIGDNEGGEVCAREISAFQVNGTMVFLSEAGLSQPRQVVFVDLASGESFLQELEV